MKTFLLIVLVSTCNLLSAQFISLRATNSTAILQDNLFTSDISRAIGGEFYFSKPFNKLPEKISFLPLDWNIGLDYQNADGVQSAFAITGISLIVYTPSGFSATSSENVTYSSFNWLNYADLNLFNGVEYRDSVLNYSGAVELGYNIGFVLGKYFFIHTGFAGRFGIVPANIDDPHENFNSVDLMLKFGFLYHFPAKRYKP